jgi:hypothetical protein
MRQNKENREKKVKIESLLKIVQNYDWSCWICWNNHFKDLVCLAWFLQGHQTRDFLARRWHHCRIERNEILVNIICINGSQWGHDSVGTERPALQQCKVNRYFKSNIQTVVPPCWFVVFFRFLSKPHFTKEQSLWLLLHILQFVMSWYLQCIALFM